MKLIFDTETTGLAPYAIGRKGFVNPSYFFEWNNCRIVQIAWILIDYEGNIVKKAEYIIKPKFFEIPIQATVIHGISHEHAMEHGIKIENVLSEFLEDVKKCSLIIAHNLDFDYNVVLAELYRMDIESVELKRIYKYCTMKHGSSPNEKWYKLSELYEKYYLKKPDLVLHNALNDVLLCKDVYIYQILESI